MRAKELEKMLLKDGWYIKNQKGSHRQYKHPDKPGKVTIPFHSGDVDKGTADSILRQAGLKQPRTCNNYGGEFYEACISCNFYPLPRTIRIHS